MQLGRTIDERFFLPAAYRFVLGRRLDPSGREAYSDAIDGGMTRRALVRDLLASDERIRRLVRRAAARRLRWHGARRRVAYLSASLRFHARRLRGERDPIDAAFRAFLRRPATASERDYYGRFLSRGTARSRTLPRLLERSVDFAEAHGVDPIPFWAVHGARMQLVQERIPAAETIVDLGGSSGEAEEGALLGMGYPHRPKRIDIIDPELDEDGRPVEHRLHATGSVRTSDGIDVVYHNRSMTDLSAFEEGSIDLVFSGESIEHVSKDEALQTLEQCYRMLRPGGSICLDTPNAAVTRLQKPHGFIHPGHGHEYRVDELREMLTEVGFVVVEELGICAMHRTMSTAVFHDIELVEGRGVHDDPENCYLFFVRAVKPERASASAAS